MGSCSQNVLGRGTAQLPLDDDRNLIANRAKPGPVRWEIDLPKVAGRRSDLPRHYHAS